MQRYIIKSKNTEPASLFFLFLVYICTYENSIYHYRNDITRIGHHRHICTAIAHHPILTIISSPLFPRLSPFICLVTQSKTSRSLHQELPGIPCYPPASQNNLCVPHLDYNKLLHFCNSPLPLAANSFIRNSRRYNLAYPFL